MKDGWHDTEYFALYESQDEAVAATLKYDLNRFLPGFYLVGMKGWDDFIVSNSQGDYFTVPTVPIKKEELQKFAFSSASLKLQPDNNLQGKVKWYIQPLIFGGSPESEENIAWITHQEHSEVVKWWNIKYLEITNAA